MAHGGIAYLARDGHSRPDAPAAFYAFVSATYDKADMRHDNPTGFKILRFSIRDYRKFLIEWVRWLQRSGVAQAAERAEAAWALDV
jgi:hypothetical protein